MLHDRFIGTSVSVYKLIVESVFFGSVIWNMTQISVTYYPALETYPRADMTEALGKATVKPPHALEP